MNATNCEQPTLFELEPIAESTPSRKSLALSGLRGLLEKRMARRIIGGSLAVAFVVGGVVEGGDYLAHRLGSEFGQAVASTISQDLTDQHLPRKFVNEVGQYTHRQLPGYINKQVKPIVTEEVNEQVYQLEEQFRIDINHDGYIGPPSEHHRVSSLQASSVAPTTTTTSLRAG